MPGLSINLVSVIGFACFWLVVMFPFAWYCTRISRPDAFTRLEAFALGIAAGPVAIFFVRKENRKAASKAALLAEREAAVQRGEIKEEWIDPQAPQAPGTHGGVAFRRPVETSAQAERVQMLTTGSAPEGAAPRSAPERPTDQGDSGQLLASDAFRPPNQQSQWPPPTEEEVNGE